MKHFFFTNDAQREWKNVPVIVTSTLLVTVCNGAFLSVQVNSTLYTLFVSIIKIIFVLKVRSELNSKYRLSLSDSILQPKFNLVPRASEVLFLHASRVEGWSGSSTIIWPTTVCAGSPSAMVLPWRQILEGFSFTSRWYASGIWNEPRKIQQHVK